MPAINEEYLYDENDICNILKSHLCEERKKDPQFKKVNHQTVARSQDDSGRYSFGEVLNIEKHEHSGARTILIPCNLNSIQWVGILIEFSSDNKIIRSLYLDSVNKTHTIDEKIINQYKAIYPENEYIQLTAHKCLTHKSTFNSGTLTVRNLILLAKHPHVPAAQVLTIKNLRNEDDMLLKTHQPELNQVFVEKQNRSLTRIDEATQTAAYYPGFKYNSLDMIHALHSRLNDIKSKIEKPWHILGPADNYDDSNLEKVLRASFTNTEIGNNARYLIIPCLISDCWFGVFININSNNDVAEAFFYDSRRNEASSPYSALCLQLKNVFPGSILKLTSCLKQDDIESSGQFAIENLVETAAGRIFPTADIINNTHLHSVQLHNRSYAPTFEFRQNLSRERLSRINNDILAELAPDKDDLFKTLLLLNFLFKELSKPQTKATDYQEIKNSITNNYATARNNQNLLYLQFTPNERTSVETVYALIPLNVQLQLAVQQNLTDFSTLSKPLGYARPSALLGAGGIVAAGSVTVDIIAMVEIGAIIANPLLLVPAALLSAYAISTYNLSFRERKVAMVLMLYSHAVDTDNVDAFRRVKEQLNGELYGTGAKAINIFSRSLRRGRSSYKQLAYTYLLLGITKAIDADEDAYDSLLLAFRCACSKYFRYANSPEYVEYRKLALLWMIHVLTSNAGVNPKNINKEQKNVLLEKYLQTLKKENPNIEVEIQDYISATIRLLLNYIRFDGNYNDLDKLKTQLNKVINFGPINALRHFKPHGPINELILTFVQALCMQNTSSERPKPKIDELILQMDLRRIENNNDPCGFIVREIQRYAQLYINNDIPKQRQHKI